MTNQDPYIGWREPLPELDLLKENTALLIIDMQYADAHMEYGLMAKKKQTDYLFSCFS